MTEDQLTAPAEPELPTPENFDLDAFVHGMRSTVRTANIYGRADLIGEIDSLEAKLAVARAAAASDEASLDDVGEVERLEQHILRVQQEFVDSGVTFAIEGRSEAWLTNIENQWKNHADTNGLSKEEKQVFINLHQLAGAIVKPTGVTYDHLVRIREASEPQLRKLLVTFAMANNQAPQVTVPFSQRSSDKTRTRRR